MEHYTKDNPLRCFFAFAGYDSQAMAMERIKQTHPDFDYTITGIAELYELEEDEETDTEMP